MTNIIIPAGLAIGTMFWAQSVSRPPVNYNEIRVVFKADDMAAAHAINIGTILAYKNGVVRSTDVIVPGPWLMEAVRLLNENPGLEVGVHLALTSEWEGVKWRPLTHAPSLVDKNGYFFPMTVPNRNFPPGSSLLEAKPNLGEVERELRAQIEMARRLIPRVSFLSAHMGAATSTPELHVLTQRLSHEYRLPIQDEQKSATWLRGIYRGIDSGPEKSRKLAAKLELLGPGTYIHLDHAAVDDPEMRAIGHEGYRFVAQDRAANVAAWTSNEVREAVRRKGIKLIHVRELFELTTVNERRESK